MIRFISRALGVSLVIFVWLDVLSRGPICAVLATLFDHSEQWLSDRLDRAIERMEKAPR